MNSIFKQAFLALVLVASFYIIIYVIIDLLVFNSTSDISDYSSSYSIDNEYSQNDKLPSLSIVDKNEVLPEQNITISKVIQENIDKINLIEQFNPTVEYDKSQLIEDLKPNKPKKASQKKQANKPKHIDKKTKTNKPKMVIIIDDVVFLYHTTMIKKIDLDITPSFIPSMNAKKAKALYSPFASHMIHLPLEAISDTSREKITLDTSSTLKQIQKLVDKSVTLFPNANFLNNHTGSKFTSNIQAMKKLYKALKKNNIKFLDSLTSINSKAKQVFGDDVYTRDIFLDNFDNVPYIKSQIKKAILIAKKNNIAIAIGHPRKNTLQAIEESIKLLKTSVDVVFIDDL